MPDASTIKFYLSGGSGNADPDLSLGGSRSNTVLLDGVATLFDHIRTEDFEDTPITAYRCIYLYNSGIDSFSSLEINFSATSTLMSTQIAYGDLNVIQSIIPNQTISPGLTFGVDSKSIPLFLSGNFLGIWLKRDVLELDDPGIIENSFTLDVSFKPYM